MERVLCDISLASYVLIPVSPDWWKPQADNRKCNWIVMNASLSEGVPWKRRWFTFSFRSHNSTWLVWKTIASSLPFVGKDCCVDNGFTVMDSPDKMDYLELFQSGFLQGTEIVRSWVYLWYQPGQQRYNPPCCVWSPSGLQFCKSWLPSGLPARTGSRREGTSASYVCNSSQGKEERFDP